MQRISARKEYVSMDRTEICDVARRTIDNVLGAENSSYTNTFKVELEADRLLFIPLVPTPLVVDEELNKKLYNALAFALYPYFTLLAPDGVDIVATRNTNYSTRRALAFTLRKGIPQRLYFEDYPKQQPGNFRVPVMENYKINFELETSIGVSGASGTGKSTFVNYLIECLSTAGADMHVIDPKSDELSKLAKSKGLKCFKAADYTNSNDFVNAVNDLLKKYIDLIHKRQKDYLETGKRDHKRYYIVIDELIALIASANKTAADTLKQQLETIAVIGRSSNVSLILIAQDWNVASSGISTTLRNQISVKVALGRPSKSSLQYLFPDIDSIIVPAGPGTGVISSNSAMDGRAYPILAPTVEKAVR